MKTIIKSCILGVCLSLTVFANSLQKPNDIKDLTLDSTYHYCQGAGKLSKIRTITFAKEPPKAYEKKWPADANESGRITGYLNGNDVTIVGEHIYLNENSSFMFAKYSGTGMPLFCNLEEIKGLQYLDASLCENMSRMFYYNDSLVDLDDMSDWDVSSVETMKFMFCGCTELRSADLSNWDVSNVADFSAMFQGADNNSGDMNLAEVNIGDWDTRSAETMGHMFYGCAKLESLDLKNWDTSHVKTFTHMFADCYGLKDIDLSGWDTRSAESFDAMFNDCRNLRRIDLTSFETSVCKQFSQMFESCYSLEHIDGIESWDASNASEYAFSEMFHGCRSLKDLDLSRWVAPYPDNTFRMFKGCGSLTELDIGGINMATVESSEEMFDGCSALIKSK